VPRRDSVLRRALQEKKRIFAEKIASNPFAFLDAEDDAEEEPEEAPQPPPASTKEATVSKKKKKKSKPAEPAAASAVPAAAPSASAGGAEEDREDGDAEEEAGHGDVERIHAELKSVEEARDFSDTAKAAAVAGVEAEPLVKLTAALMTRRGMDHENEDRGLMSELTNFVSPALKETLLRQSRSRSMPVFAVFDGHGGDGASEYAKERLLPNVGAALEELHAAGVDGDAAMREAYTTGFARTEDELRARAATGGDRSGTCAVCVVVWEQDGVYRLHTANLGDCRAMLARRDSATGKLVGVRVTDDHRAVTPEERRRIEAAGDSPPPSPPAPLASGRPHYRVRAWVEDRASKAEDAVAQTVV
jgi:hypothetical protein